MRTSARSCSTGTLINWVLARARFFLSNEFDGNVDYLKDGRLSTDDLLSLMIFGIHSKAPSLADMYDLNVVAWLGSTSSMRCATKISCVTSETSRARSRESYFATLMEACGISPVPANWRERVTVGADRRRSGTARENLTGIAVELPLTLPERHRQLVDYAAPGLRQLLGYA